jgi:hypothetical protein
MVAGGAERAYGQEYYEGAFCRYNDCWWIDCNVWIHQPHCLIFIGYCRIHVANKWMLVQNWIHICACHLHT